MTTCAQCGAGIPDDAAKCPSCGAPRPNESRRGWSLALLIAGGVALGAVLVGGTIAFLTVGRTARGALVSLTTSRPIAGATIRTPSGVVRTDATGGFQLSDLRLGQQPVTITATGFAPFHTTLQVHAFGVTQGDIKLPDAAVTVHVEEMALQQKPVTDAKAAAGSTNATGTEPSTFVLRGLRPGPTTITVTSPSHEPTRTTVDLVAGSNDVTIHMHLTPGETYARYFDAWKAGQWKAAYAYLHPDVAKRESLATYTKDMKGWGAPVSYELRGTRTLATWTSQPTGMTYKDVAEVTRALVTQKTGYQLQSATPQHWVKLGGLWLRVDY